MITSNHKNFKSWKKAFKLCGKEAGIESSVIEESIKKSPKSPNKKKRERESDDEGASSKKRKSSSTSPARGNSPKKTARHASVGGKKKSPQRKAPKKRIISPQLEGSENLFRELLQLLDKYSDENEDSANLLQLLRIITNFSIPDNKILESVPIASAIQKLTGNEEDRIKNAAQKNS